MMLNEIRFYKATGQYGFLSNLFKHPVTMDGREFPTSEHAYQFKKFADPKAAEWAMQAPRPHLLAILAHGLFRFDVAPGWSGLKIDHMRAVLRVKFDDPEMRDKLLGTGEAVLIEDSKMDPFWGVGKKGTGRNMLGRLLMQIRTELQV